MNDALAIESLRMTLMALDRHNVLLADAFDDDPLGTARERDQVEDFLIGQLEIARRIATALGEPSFVRRLQPHKLNPYRMSFPDVRETVVVLLTLLERREEIEAIVGPSGPSLSASALHPIVWEASARLLDNDHPRQAVQNAAQALESHLQVISGPRWAGTDLAKLFRSLDRSADQGPILYFGDVELESDTQASAREGAAALIRGAASAIRNLVSHPGWPDPDRDEAIEMLAVLSYVARLVDRASPVT